MTWPIAGSQKYLQQQNKWKRSVYYRCSPVDRQNQMWRLELIFYIETNFLMSIATGRDPEALTLLQNPPESVQIAIPCICCLEALSVLEQEEKSRKIFEQELDLQINRAQPGTAKSDLACGPVYPLPFTTGSR